MRINEGVAIASSAVVLVPYSKSHVPKYHSWMKDEEIREATASELLTLEEEYSMQKSWRRDADKLTFIACSMPLRYPEINLISGHVFQGGTVSSGSMIGDVNLFLRLQDDESLRDDPVDNDRQESKQQLVGELELMIAEKSQRRRGYGRASLLCFLRYILENESSIIGEYFSQGLSNGSPGDLRFSYLNVKIGESNYKSLALFESLGFSRVTEKPNIFGELELRKDNLDAHWPRKLLEKHCICDYLEITYNEERYTGTMDEATPFHKAKTSFSPSLHYGQKAQAMDDINSKDGHPCLP